MDLASPISEERHGLYPIYDVEYVPTPLAENPDGFLTQRGDWELLHLITGAGEGIKVGVGDTGIDPTHRDSDLSGVIEAKDFTGSRYGWQDRHGHGSHCSGHISARRNDNGMIGLAPKCELYHAKVLGDNGSGSSVGIANGIRWMIDKGCHIISLSLGGGFSQDIENACRDAANAGVMVMAAMGNEGTRGDGHPGNSRYTFGIVAVDYNKQLASFSSRSKMAKYSGYGVNVLSCGLNGKYVKMSGTSMATPDQSGLLALYLSWRLKVGLPLPQTMEELEGLYRPGVEDLGSPGFDVGYGLGFVDIWKLINNNPPMPPTTTTSTTSTTTSPTPGNRMGLGLVQTDDGLKVLGMGSKPAQLIVDGRVFEGSSL